MVFDSLNVLGIMSGTSCDGLDLCLANFKKENNVFNYKVIKAVTIGFPSQLKKSLQNSINLSGIELIKLNKEWSDFASIQIKKHFNSNDYVINLISSHGHTVFHQPNDGINFQLGSLDVLCASTKIDVVGDFRSIDIAKGGQGAPLVPFGDEKLFNEYDVCINLGGFANLSFDDKGIRKAFDISPCNLVLNHFSSMIGHEFDEGGEIAKTGILIDSLLNELNSLPYYKNTIINDKIKGEKEFKYKSLGVEQLKNEIFPLLFRYQNQKQDISDILNTFIHHVADQIKNSIPSHCKSILFTGGGVYNNYLLSVIQGKIKNKNSIIPDKELIDFKEALIFGFLGYLRVNELENISSTYTGARSNSISGHYLRY